MLVGNDNELQKLMACGHFNGLTLHLARSLTAAPCFNKLVVANDFSDTSMNGIRSLKESACGGIGKLNEPLHIGDEHTIGDLVQDGGEAGAVFGPCRKSGGASGFW